MALEVAERDADEAEEEGEEALDEGGGREGERGGGGFGEQFGEELEGKRGGGKVGIERFDAEGGGEEAQPLDDVDQRDDDALQAEFLGCR